VTGLIAPSGSRDEYTYNPNGARESESAFAADIDIPETVTAFEYGLEGGLARVQRVGEDSVDISYVADGDGLRQSRTAGASTSEFLWNVVSDTPLLMSDGSLDFIYGPLATPLAQVSRSTSHVDYLHSDLIGSVRWITDSSATVTSSKQFAPYGSQVKSSGIAESPIGFTGAWTDPDTDLVYLRSRDLDPKTGQFLTVDPAVDTTGEPYAYASGNPVQKIDPSGRRPDPGSSASSLDRPTSDSVWWQAAVIGEISSTLEENRRWCFTPQCIAAMDTFQSYASTAEGRIILGWALGISPREMHYGADTGVVAHLQGVAATVDALRALQTGLAAGVASVGFVQIASYDAGKPGLGNSNFTRDAHTYTHWDLASDSDRVLAALGSYLMKGTVSRIDERCRIATVVFYGSNTATLGSAGAFSDELRDALNEISDATGLASPTTQYFSWTEYVRY
jgi:RHS repeat-associated protein